MLLKKYFLLKVGSLLVLTFTVRTTLRILDNGGQRSQSTLPRHSNLCSICFNARNLANKVDKLENLLLYDPHISGITETLLHDLISDDEIVQPGYQIFRQKRGFHGGGAAVIAKDTIDTCLVDEIPDIEGAFFKYL